jgi:hypothetical protein
VNPPYAWVIHREPARIILPLQTKLRRRLEADLDTLAEHPLVEPQEIWRTADGLEVRFLWRDPFWIGYVLDHAVREVRIVSLSREKLFNP